MNNESGYMVRTKISSSDEGGVLPGFGVIDSVYLTWGSQLPKLSWLLLIIQNITLMIVYMLSFKSPIFTCLSPEKMEEEGRPLFFFFLLFPMTCLQSVALYQRDNDLFDSWILILTNKDWWTLLTCTFLSKGSLMGIVYQMLKKNTPWLPIKLAWVSWERKFSMGLNWWFWGEKQGNGVWYFAWWKDTTLENWRGSMRQRDRNMLTNKHVWGTHQWLPFQGGQGNIHSRNRT